MIVKYAYACGWTDMKKMIKTYNQTAFFLCHHLDYHKDVIYFDRPTEPLTYQIKNNKRRLTPDLIVTHKAKDKINTLYLHCIKRQRPINDKSSGILTQEDKEALQERYQIRFIYDDELSVNKTENIQLLHRYLKFPIGGKPTESPTSESLENMLPEPITPLQLSKYRNITLGKANRDLLELAATRVLKFNISEKLTDNTVFEKVEH